MEMKSIWNITKNIFSCSYSIFSKVIINPVTTGLNKFEEELNQKANEKESFNKLLFKYGRY